MSRTREANKSPRRERKAASIRWKLLYYFLSFMVLFLLITWLFQVHLLGNFYEYAKRNELRRTGDALASDVGSDNLRDAVYYNAFERSISVRVIRFTEDGAEVIADVDATGGMDMFMTGEQMALYFNKALNEGGSYLAKINAFGGREVRSPGLFSQRRFDDIRNGGKNYRLVYVRLTEDEDGIPYMIFLNASLVPLDSTVQTLKLQFLWIVIALLPLAGLISFLLYRRISKPLIQMDNEAKQLALGKYDVEFHGKGYRETMELAETLNYASNELSKVDNLQKELLANISHDLRTPLTMIKGYSEIVRDLPGENTPENMQVIIDETTRLSELVNDLLDLSRIQAGNREVQPELFDISGTIRDVVTRYVTLTRHKGYRIEAEAADSCNVYADRGMILQVLCNLINNAINYTGEDLFVSVCLEKKDGKVRVSVRDTGDGIPEDQIPMIWDRYYRVDKVHKRAMIGTGLGLSIVKKVLELHHAAYGVNSRLGEGSVFWFELPIIPERNENV